MYDRSSSLSCLVHRRCEQPMIVPVMFSVKAVLVIATYDAYSNELLWVRPLVTSSFEMACREEKPSTAWFSAPCC